MTIIAWVRALWQRLSTSIWLMPSAAIALATVLGLILADVQLDGDGRFGSVFFGGTPEGARSLLSTVAGSTITVLALTFSLTVLALQLAASQFSPRVLRTFLADRGNQAVLSVLLGTFLYTLLVLRRIRRGTEDLEAYVPQLAVTVALVLAVLSVVMLLFFFHHLSQQLRIESVLREVERDSLRLIGRFSELDSRLELPLSLPLPPADAVTVPATRSGYLQAVESKALFEGAVRHGLVLRIRPSLGTHVPRGTTMAWAWRVDEYTVSDAAVVSSMVNRALTVGFERTLQQDIGFGVQQLVDIIARSLSPSTNDPATAVNAIGSLSVVMCALADRQLGPVIRQDEDARVRIAAPAPTFGELLALACDQPLRYGRDEPMVVAAVLRLLTDVAEVVATHRRRRAVRQQLDAIRPIAHLSGLESLAEECEHALRAAHRLSGSRGEEPDASPG